MGVKPLEKPDKSLYIRVGIVIFLVIVGLTINLIRNKQVKNKEVLGTEKSVEVGKPISTEEVYNRGKTIANDVVTQSENVLSNVLGEVTSYVSGVASQSAETVSNYVFDNTVGNLIKQIDKLPQKQQEDIKRNLCQ